MLGKIRLSIHRFILVSLLCCSAPNWATIPDSKTTSWKLEGAAMVTAISSVVLCKTTPGSTVDRAFSILILASSCFMLGYDLQDIGEHSADSSQNILYPNPMVRSALFVSVMAGLYRAYRIWPFSPPR